MRIGFEREFLLTNVGAPSTGVFDVILPTTVHFPSQHLDADQLHVEARGEPHYGPLEACGSLIAKERILTAEAKKINPEYFLDARDWFQLPKGMQQAMRRMAGKGRLEERCLYGEVREPRKGWSAGGLHIHFGTEPYKNHCKCGRVFEYSHAGTFDIPHIVKSLDKRFGLVIAAAKRQPGRYELKPHGFEYRSLPTSQDPWEVAEFLRKFLAKNTVSA